MKRMLIVLFLLMSIMTSVSAFVCGDLNSDGSVDIIDALLCAQYYVGIPVTVNEMVADVNGDGTSDIVDALLIAQYYVGLIDRFEGCTGTTPLPEKTPEVLFAVNCGGDGYTASDGTEYSADTAFLEGWPNNNSESFEGTQDNQLYQSKRLGDFSYSFDVPIGYYQIALHFSEVYYDSTQARIFNVVIEGIEVIRKFDIYAEVGGKTACIIEIDSMVNDEELNIEFQSEEGSAMINAIKVSLLGPNAKFNYSPAIPLCNQIIDFDASTSSDFMGTILSYSWDFGDAGRSIGKITSHIYSTIGEYYASLTVVDDQGCTGAVTQKVIVYDENPVPDFFIAPLVPVPGEAVKMDSSGSFDPDGKIISYTWDFGDGSSGTGEVVEHIYKVTGEYQITLSVSDDQGNKRSKTKTLKLYIEDSGYDLPVGSPQNSNGGSSVTLPDPFTKWDGTLVKTMEDWRWRRRELLVELEKKLLGEKAPPPALIGGTVTGNITNREYTVKVDNPKGSISFSGRITLPKTGSAPYPAIIILNGKNSLSSYVLEKEEIALIDFDCETIASGMSGNFVAGKYYLANPDYRGKTGAFAAWAWGVSRLIDMLEQNPEIIDPGKIAVHACATFGKAAFAIGALDQRIALGLPQEPGTGGPAPLRSISVYGGESLEECNGISSWFGPSSPNFNSSIAVDMNDLAVLYAPRGLLLFDSAYMDIKSYKASYLGMAAASEIYKAMGREDGLWYLGNTNNGTHCAARIEYANALRAMIRKFLKDDNKTITGGLDKHLNHGNIDVDSWTSTWNIGPITGLASPPWTNPTPEPTWSGKEIQKLTALDRMKNDWFGTAVSISGDYAIIGATGKNDKGDQTGAAYIFYKNREGTGTWAQAAKLTASDAKAGHWFGYSVSIDGDYAIVGAKFDSENVGHSGAAYIFYRNQGGSNQWGQVAKLKASDGEYKDYFGTSVSINGDYAIVGAAGSSISDLGAEAAYIFYKNQGGEDQWGQLTKLTALDGKQGDSFGISVSISGDYAIVGAEYGRKFGKATGAAYIFSKNQGGKDKWGQLAKLTASDGMAGDYFGFSVSIDGDNVIVGAEYNDANGEYSGAAYIFFRHHGGYNQWGEVTKLSASDAESGDHFGHSVSISGDYAIVGATFEAELGRIAGAAYLFYRNQEGSNHWGQVSKLLASDGMTYDWFGDSVSLSENYAIVGAFEEEKAAAAGAAYIFSHSF